MTAEDRKEAGRKQRALLGKLAEEAGLATKRGRRSAITEEMVTEKVAMLASGTVVRKGKEVKLGIQETVGWVARLVKWGKAERVPAVVATRYPWGAISRPTIDAVAETFGVTGESLLSALLGEAPAMEQAVARGLANEEPPAEPRSRTRRSTAPPPPVQEEPPAPAPTNARGRRRATAAA